MDCCKQKNILTKGQETFLNAFFKKTSDFYLTGGTALSGFYLGHRTSIDLDFFTQSENVFDELDFIIHEVSSDITCEIKSIRITNYFKHYEADMPDGPLTIHSAKDIAVRIAPVQIYDSLIIDSIEDITANKICAFLGRNSMKDFIDLYFLDSNGYTIENFLSIAQQKDGGLFPETLAYSFNQLNISNIPSYVKKKVNIKQLLDFKNKIITYLTTLSFPK